MNRITVYAVLSAYDDNDNVYYQIAPYSLIGLIKINFKYGTGLFSLMPFLVNCRFTEREAKRLKDRKNALK